MLNLNVAVHTFVSLLFGQFTIALRNHFELKFIGMHFVIALKPYMYFDYKITALYKTTKLQNQVCIPCIKA
jgi:hypothetical protein